MRRNEEGVHIFTFRVNKKVGTCPYEISICGLPRTYDKLWGMVDFIYPGVGKSIEEVRYEYFTI